MAYTRRNFSNPDLLEMIAALKLAGELSEYIEYAVAVKTRDRRRMTASEILKVMNQHGGEERFLAAYGRRNYAAA